MPTFQSEHPYLITLHLAHMQRVCVLLISYICDKCVFFFANTSSAYIQQICDNSFITYDIFFCSTLTQFIYNNYVCIKSMLMHLINMRLWDVNGNLETYFLVWKPSKKKIKEKRKTGKQQSLPRTMANQNLPPRTSIHITRWLRKLLNFGRKSHNYPCNYEVL